MCKLINFFTFKDKIPIFLCSDIVYKVKCGDCNATYYAKLSTILKSITILPLKKINYYAIITLFFHTSQQQKWIKEFFNQLRPPSFE